MRICPALPAAVLAMALGGCAHRPVSTAAPVAPTLDSVSPSRTVVSPTLAGDRAHPGQTQGWVDTKLYFGLGPANDSARGISEAQWQEFLDTQVTTRFPAGLSVVDVYGQWQGKKEAVPSRLRSKMIIIDYSDTQENRDKIEAIRAAWKQQTGAHSVLRVTEPADVSF
jgi:hypothetical protein